MATRWLTIGQNGPEVTAPGGLPARVQHRRAGLVDEDALGPALMGPHAVDDRHQVETPEIGHDTVPRFARLGAE
jgi:hypothetical protein